MKINYDAKIKITILIYFLVIATSNGSDEITICEGSLLSLSCPASSVLNITSVVYGFLLHSGISCGSSVSGTGTASEEPLAVVRDACQGLNRCSLIADTNVLNIGRDPAPGSNKYTVIEYDCGPLPIVSINVNGTNSSGLINVALLSSGAFVSVSSVYSSSNLNFNPASVINGLITAEEWGNDGGWNSAGPPPAWIEVTLSKSSLIMEVNVFTYPDSGAVLMDPSLTFTQYGITAFQIEAWNFSTSSFVTLSGGSYTNNNLVWVKLQLTSPVYTNVIRVYVTAALAGYARIVKLQVLAVPGSSRPLPTLPVTRVAPTTNQVNNLLNSVSSNCHMGAFYYDKYSQIAYIACANRIIGIANGNVFTVATPSSCTAYQMQYSDASKTLYASCNSEGGILSIVSEKSSMIVNASVCPSPFGLFYDDDSATLYAACRSQIISLMDGVVTTVVDQSCSSLTYDFGSTTLYAVCNSNENVVKVVNGLSRIILDSSVCFSPTSLSYVADLATLYVTCFFGGIMSFRNGVIATFASTSICRYGSSLSYDSASAILYAGCASEMLSFNIAGVTRDLTQMISTVTNQFCYNIQAVSVGLDSSIFGTCGSSILVFQTPLGAATTVADPYTCPSPYSVFYDSNDAILYIACWNAGSVLSITNGIVATVVADSACPYPSAVLYDSASATLYASCSNGQAVIAVTNGNIVSLAPLDLCLTPGNLVYDSFSSTLFVSCQTGVYSMSTLPTAVNSFTEVIGNSNCNAGTFSSLSYLMAFDPVYAILYVACSEGIMSVQNGGVYKKIVSTSICPSSTPSTTILVYDADSSTLFAACNNAVLMINVRAGIVGNVVNASACGFATSLFYDSGSATLYVGCGTEVIMVRNGIGATVLGGCPSPKSFAYDSSSATLFVACETTTVSVSFTSCPVGFFWSYSSGCNLCPVGFSSTSYGPSTASAVLRKGRCFACPAGRYSSSLGSVSCLASPPGTWSILQSSSTSLCDAGYVGLGIGTSTSSTCDGDCPGGYTCPTGIAAPIPCGSPSSYCPPGSSSPRVSGVGFFSLGGDSIITHNATLPCPPGSFCLEGLQYFCTKGTFSNSSQATFCDSCTLGSITAINGASTCTACVFGTYAAQSGLSFCSSCSAGKFSNTSQATLCYDCSPGSYSSQDHASTCAPCQIGTYAEQSGLSACVTCSAGKYANISSTICSICTPGSVAEVNGASTCTSCVIGTYAEQSGLSLCSSCSAGKFANASQATLCYACSPGTFSAQDRASSCTPCQIGTFAEQSGISTCFSCSPGNYASLEGTTSCSPCEIGHFANVSSAASCSACLPPTYAPSNGAIICQTCASGFYSLGAGSSLCSSCPPGCDCHAGTITVAAGFFAFINSNDSTVTTVSCPLANCVGGMIAASSTIVVQQCALNRDPNALLCGSCLSNFSDYTGECVFCPETNIGLLCLILICGFLYMLVLHLSAQSTEVDPVPIFMYFIQVVLVVVGPVQAYVTWMSFFSLSSTQSSGSQSSQSSSPFSYCLGPIQGVDNFSIAYLTPAVFFAELLLVIAALKTYSYYRASRQSKTNVENVDAPPYSSMVEKVFSSLDSIPQSFDSFVRTTISLLFYTYSGLTIVTFNWLRCVDVQGHLLVFSEPSIDCSSDSYKRLSVLVYIVLILDVVGLPVCVALFLFYHRAMIKQFHDARSKLKASGQATLDLHTSNHEEVTRSLFPLSKYLGKNSASPIASQHNADASGTNTATADPRLRALDRLYRSFKQFMMPNVRTTPDAVLNSFVDRYGILFQTYTYSEFYWIVSMTIRRTICSAIASAYSDNVSARALAIFLVHFVALMLQERLRPYRHRVNNFLESVSLGSLTLIASIVSAYQTPPYPVAMQIFVCALIFFTITVSVCCLLGTSFAVKRRNTFDEKWPPKRDQGAQPEELTRAASAEMEMERNLTDKQPTTSVQFYEEFSVSEIDSSPTIDR